MEDEFWVPMEGNSKYEVSSHGKIRSVRYKKPIKLNPLGYAVIVTETGTPRQVTRRVEDIMLETFTGLDPKEYVVDFRDGDRANCRLDNLAVRDKTAKYQASDKGDKFLSESQWGPDRCYHCGNYTGHKGMYAILCGPCWQFRHKENVDTKPRCHCGSFVTEDWDGICRHHGNY